MLDFSPTTPRALVSIDTMIDFQRYGYALVAHCNQHFRNHEFDNDRFAAHFSRSSSKVQEGRTHVGYPQCDVIESYYVKPKPSWNVYN